MPKYVYRPLADSRAFIRLLTVHSVGPTTSCSLDDFPIEDAPPFHAVSYCWGIDAASEKVEIGGDWIAVTPHLLEGIRSLHKVASPPKLWIDAICINQTDHVEKEGQIPLMGNIYGNAEKVLVWLGEGVEACRLAMESITSLVVKLSSLDTKILNHQLFDADFPQRDHQIWTGLEFIFNNPWFNRVWPLQEFILAEEVEFFCRQSKMKMTDLCELASELVRIGRHLLFSTDYHKHGFLSGIESLIALRTIRGQVSSRESAVFCFELLRCAREKRATEAVDHVYALLGMLTEEIRSRVEILYSEKTRNEYWKVYVSLAAAMLTEDCFQVLNMAESKDQILELPSWCPNWGSPQPSNSFWTGFEAGWVQDITPPPSRATVLQNHEIFRCAGFQFDRIQAIVALDWSADFRRLRETIESCCGLVEKCTDLRDKNLDCKVARTLVADTSYGEDGLIIGRYMWNVVEDYNLTRRVLHFLFGSGSPPGLDPETNDNDVDFFRRYYRMIYWMWDNRCFFVTERGFLGLGSSRCKVGDTLCVLFGSRNPLAIRQRLGNGNFELIGPAYVDGIMDGESVRSRDPEMDRDFLFS